MTLDEVAKQNQIDWLKRLPEDYNERLRLSKMIGLEKIPEPDSKSIDRLSEILREKVKHKNYDAVKLVRDVRG